MPGRTIATVRPGCNDVYLIFILGVEEFVIVFIDIVEAWPLMGQLSQKAAMGAQFMCFFLMRYVNILLNNY